MEIIECFGYPFKDAKSHPFRFGQKAISMKETEKRRDDAMSEASGKSTNDIYIYNARGDDQPFNGILFAKYPNGNYS